MRPPGFDSQTPHHMWVEFVAASLYSAPTVFSPGTPVSPFPQKLTFSNSNLILECTEISERLIVTHWCYDWVNIHCHIYIFEVQTISKFQMFILFSGRHIGRLRRSVQSSITLRGTF